MAPRTVDTTHATQRPTRVPKIGDKSAMKNAYFMRTYPQGS